MKETRDVDTAGSFGQMSFCQVGIDSGHGKQAGNDLHTCTLYICGSWAPKKSKNGDTNAWIFEKKTAVCILVGGECTKAWHMKNHLATCHRHQAFVAGIVNSHLICGGLAVCDIF